VKRLPIFPIFVLVELELLEFPVDPEALVLPVTLFPVAPVFNVLNKPLIPLDDDITF
jgi:hypothetical protein